MYNDLMKWGMGNGEWGIGNRISNVQQPITNYQIRDGNGISCICYRAGTGGPEEREIPEGQPPDELDAPLFLCRPDGEEPGSAFSPAYKGRTVIEQFREKVRAAAPAGTIPEV